MSSVAIQFGAFSAERIDGWAYDTANPARRVTLLLTIDGNFERRVKCNIRRREFEIDIGHNRVGFNASIPPVFRDGNPHRVQLHDAESGDLLRDEMLPTQSIRFADREGGWAYAAMTLLTARRIRGWASSAAGPVTVDLEIDGILVASTRATDPVTLDRDYEAGFLFARLPVGLYDGGTHAVAVYAHAAARVLVASETIAFPRDDVPRLAGEIAGAADLGIVGQAVDSRAPERALDLALLVDRVEVARTRTDPAAEPPGAYRFDLANLPHLDWIRADIAVVSMPDGLSLRYRGRHPVRDALAATILTRPAGRSGLLIEGPLALPAAFAVEIAAGGAVLERIAASGVQGARFVQPVLDVDLPAGAAVAVTLDGLALPVTVAEEAAGPDAAAAAALPLGSFVDPLDPRVQRSLSALVRGEAAGDPDAALADFTGVWSLRTPTQADGWALDLADARRPLSLDLLIDGKILASMTATQPAVPREARIDAVLPVGFSFDLGDLARQGRSHLVEVSVAGGGMLLPGQPRRVSYGSVSAPAARVLAIDDLVAAGAVAPAYLLARAGLGHGQAAIADRLLVLDFVLRAEWSFYPAFLAGWDGRASLDVLRVLDGLFQPSPAGDEDGQAETPGIAALHLPPAYRTLLQAAIAGSGEAEALAVRATLWSVLAQLPDGFTGAPDCRGMALVTGDAPSPAAREQFAAFEAMGGRIVPDAAAAGDAALVVSFPAPRLVSAVALGYWRAAIAAAGGGFCTVASVPAGLQSATRFGLIGRTGDTETVLRYPDARDADAPAELLTYRIRPLLAGAGTVVVLHDPDAVLPAVPVGAACQALDGSLDAAVERLAAGGAADDAAVIVLRAGIAYPAAYLRDCLLAFGRAGQDRSIVPFGLGYDPKAERFAAETVAGDAVSFLGLAGSGCFLLGDLTRSLRRHGSLDGKGIVVATARPFVVTLLAAPAMDAVIDGPPSLAERAQGFTGHQLATWTGAAEALGVMRPPGSVVLPAGGVMRDESGRSLLYRTVRRLATGGHVQRARGLTLAAMAPDALLDGAADGLADLLQSCKLLGLQPEFAARCGILLPALLERFPGAVIPAFETLAVAAPPETLAGLAVACMARLLPQPEPAPIVALATVGKRYVSADSLVLLLAMIDGSGHRALLRDPGLARPVGEALLRHDIAFTLPESRLGPEHFRARAPLLPRIVQAIGSGDRAAFVEGVNDHLAGGGDVRTLILAIRTYSAEIASFAVQPGEIWYPAGGDRLLLLTLAIVLGDAAGMAERRGVGGDIQAIVAASHAGDLAPLEAAFARWGAPYGVVPVPFAGASVPALFAALGAAPLPEPVPGHGRVSVLMTVYNPDLGLLDQSLASILRQTYRDLEIILVDDASDAVDPVGIAALAARDPRIRFLRLPRNAGPYAGRNRALAIATGDFVCIQDGDDYAHPQRIAVQVAQLVATPLAMLCTTAHLRIDRDARLQFEHTLDLMGDGTMTSMFRRSVFDVIGGFAPVRSRGDVEFRERIKASMGRHVHVHVDCPLLFCFATPGSLSNSVVRGLPDYLGLFRDAFARRLRHPVVNGRRLGPGDDAVVVPWPLRVTAPGPL